MKIKIIAKNILKYTPFYPQHIGNYERNLMFWKYVKRLPIEKFTKILDAGCGEGRLCKKLAAKYSHLQVNAYDVKRYKSWTDEPNNINFRQINLLNLEEENSYDFCLCIDVLEHISENRRALEKIYRALRVDGYFYLHTPSKNQSRIFPARFFKEFDEWEKEEHIGEMYNLKELLEEIMAIGFKIIEARETFGFFGKLAWEIDRITDKYIVLKIILMPLLKLFAYLDIKFAKKGGGILILAMKK